MQPWGKGKEGRGFAFSVKKMKTLRLVVHTHRLKNRGEISHKKRRRRGKISIKEKRRRGGKRVYKPGGGAFFLGERKGGGTQTALRKKKKKKKRLKGKRNSSLF